MKLKGFFRTTGKRCFGLALALTMALSAGASAFAADGAVLEPKALAPERVLAPNDVLAPGGSVSEQEGQSVSVPAQVPAEIAEQAVNAPSVPPEIPGETVNLVILGTSDMHGNIWGFSYEDQKDTENNGMARVASYVKQVRAENPNVLLIDNGDLIQGTILTDDLYNKKYLDETHPVMNVMNELGYNAMTLGNHEFNFGLDLVERIEGDANFPLLSANSTYKADGSQFVEPYTIIECAGLQVGVIGITTPNIPRWDGEKVDALQFGNMGQTAAQMVEEIKDEADIIVVAAHAGMVAEYDEEGKADSAGQILVDAPDVDVLLTGHFHTANSEKIGNTVVGSPRNSGRDVVRFDITVDISGDEPVIVNSAVQVVDMANITIDQSIRDLTKTAHENTLEFINGSVDAEGNVTGGVFGTASASFQPVNEIKDIPEGKLRDTAVMDLINNIQLKYSGADVSAAALFQDTSDIKAGNITYANVFNIYKFDNTLYVVEVTGAELKAYMEWSASCYNQWKEGDISISFDPEKPGYLYDMFEGVDYKIDLSKPAGERIVDVMYKGAPLSDSQVLKLAVNNYRYSSALKSENLVAGSRIWESPVSIRDYIVQYITEQGTITPSVNNNWEITGVDLEHPQRQQVVDMVNNGELDVPYDKSLNIDELISSGVITAE